MKYIRIKAISNCVGIRRSAVEYINKASDLDAKLEYPLCLIDLKLDDKLDKANFFWQWGILSKWYTYWD